MCGGVTGKSVFRKLAVPDVLGAAVFVSRVQSVICSFDENFTPLDQCCGQESEEGADDHFLHEGGVHLALFGAREVPPRKWPFPRKLQGPTSNYQQGGSSCGRPNCSDQTGGVNRAHNPSMKFCIFVGINLGGYVGWLLAENLGLMIAFIASGVGSAVGVYLGWRVARAVLN